MSTPPAFDAAAPVLARRVFPARLADLAFAMDVPVGFVEVPIPEEDTDFDDPTKSAPLAVLSSPVAVAVVTVAARPAYADGTVLDWLRYLSSHYGIDLQHVLIRTVGTGEGHPGVTAFGVQFQEGTKVNLMLVAFEDGGRFVTALGLCPAELWPSYGASLAAAVESITLERPKGSTHSVDDPDVRSEAFAKAKARGLAEVNDPRENTEILCSTPEPESPLSGPRVAAIGAARGHLAEDEFDEAERSILSVDSTIQGAVKLAALYEEHLRTLLSLAAGGIDKARAEQVFRRALSWAQSCYPEPHTEYEVERYEAGRAEDRAHLIGVLGYDPDRAGGRTGPEC